MKIVQVSTYDVRGGAARAAYRLHKGLVKTGRDCTFLARRKYSSDDTVIAPSSNGKDERFLYSAIQNQYINAHRTEISNTVFSHAYPGWDISSLSLVTTADIINLHWIAHYQSPVTLFKMFNLGKPVVWTLHDQSAFTGGCHYTAGCEGYQNRCVDCPQLSDDPFTLPEMVLKDKLELFKTARLTIVAPSRWLADCARKSRLFKDRRIEVIPYSLETDLFKPVPKQEAKRKLDLAPDTVHILFVAEYHSEKRKGFEKLASAFQECMRDTEFRDLVNRNQVELICTGEAGEALDSIEIPIKKMGYIKSDEKMSLAYSAADIFVLPSLEDNLPNTMLESMSCGTPVVAFDAGGIPDAVIHDKTGKLVPAGDIVQLSAAVRSLVFDKTAGEEMGRNGRRLIMDEFSLEIQPRRYMQLYEDLLDGSREALTSNNTRPGPGNTQVAADKTSRIQLETREGPYFKTISDQVLLYSLKQQSLDLRDRLTESENDRAKRLEQVNELESLLKKSDKDRAKRLEQVNELEGLLKESESDRAARLAQIHRLTDIANAISESLKKSEADREDLQKNICQMQKDIRRLQTMIHQRDYDLLLTIDRLERLERSFAVRLARKLRFIKSAHTQPAPVAADSALPDNRQSDSAKNSSMHIAVDLTPVQPGGKNGGAKIVAMALLKSIRETAAGDRFTLLTASWNHDELAVLDGPNMSRLCVLKGPEPDDWSQMDTLSGYFRRGIRKLHRITGRFSSPGGLRKGLRASLKADALFCPFTAPTYAEPGVPVISVVHDLQHREFPQFFDHREIAHRDAFLRDVREKADKIVCVSEHVRKTVLEAFDVEPGRVSVIHNCIQVQADVPEAGNNAAHSKIPGLGKNPYMFYPANFWPHKNHRMLLTAFGMFVNRNPEKPIDLVLTGALDDYQNELKNAARKMGLADRVHFLGFLDRDRFASVFQNALFLIFPSLYEGFGIPVLEAMALGKPVLCSGSASLPEVAGDAALFFDPKKPDEIAKRIERIVDDASLRKRLIENGYRRLDSFKPEQMTQKYLSNLRSVIESPAVVDNCFQGIYKDGWLGVRASVSYCAGHEDRLLLLRFKVPESLPYSKVKIAMKDGNMILEKLKLRPGEDITCRKRIYGKAGRLDLSIRPGFRPSEHGMGQDDRQLGVLCLECAILSRDEGRTSLFETKVDR